MKKFKNISILSAVLVLVPVLSAPAQISQNGNYRIEQTVISSGGGIAGTGTLRVEGTIGQPVAGTLSTNNANLAVRGGFWNAAPLAPNSAAALVGGRVLTSDGRGVTNVVVTLSGGTLTSPRTARTSALGNFAFDEVESGQIYLLTITSRKFDFPQTSLLVPVSANVTDIVFQAFPE